MEKPLEEYSKEELVEMVTSLRKQKKFGLVWEGKPEKVAIDCNKKLPVLKEVSEKAIYVGKENNPTHILIEGDNYHALSALNYTHKGIIDLIYIDPPYNTGNSGFFYNDRIVDGNDAFRHSKWLSFMYRRLKLAYNMLANHGIIFISIDDNELFNLKLICDKIFLEKNFLGNIIQNKGNAQNDANNIQKNHDYILCYTKNRNYINLSGGKKKEKTLISTSIIDKKKVNIDEHGNYFYLGSGLLTGSNPTLSERTNLGYTVYYNPETKHKIAIHDYDERRAIESNDESYVYSTDNSLVNNGYIVIRPPKKNGKLGRWTWGLEKFNNESDRIYINDKDYSVKKKEYVNRANVFKQGNSLIFENKRRTSNIKSIYDFSTASGTESLRDVLPDSSFNNPKNVDMVKFLVESINNNNAIILDFFAGSGTTAQAVLELNKEDGGNRQCILCTNNENNIAEDVTYPRVKTVITGIRPDGSEYSDGIPANFRYFKTDFVEKGKTTDATRENLVARATDILRIKERTFIEEIDTATFKIYSNHQKLTVIVFDSFKMTDIWKEVESLCTKKHNIKVCLYIFSYSPDVSAFTDDIPKTTGIHWESKPIPDGILATYKQIFKEKETE